jgi:hypothetical protein
VLLGRKEAALSSSAILLLGDNRFGLLPLFDSTLDSPPPSPLAIFGYEPALLKTLAGVS